MANYNFNTVDPLLYERVIKSKVIRPRFKLLLLNSDESVKEDISHDLILGSGALSINYQQGARRSLTFSLNNEEGKYTPDENSGYIWINTKFRFELGIELNDEDVCYNSAGIFVVSSPVSIRKSAENIVTFQCSDKFALLDGTLGGVLEGAYEIPTGTKIKKALQDILLRDNGNGEPIDSQPIIYDSSFEEETLYYKIAKTPNESLGAMMIEMADMLGADIWYNNEGNLVFKSGIRDIVEFTKPTLWNFSEYEIEYMGNDINYNFSGVKNRVRVTGANVNGAVIYSAIAENNNPKSPTRISKIGVKNLYIENSNIYSDSLARQYAEYELNKISILQLLINVFSTYMIHLDVNFCITITDSFNKLHRERFIIQSLSVPLSIESTISIQCTNVASLPFYENR